MVNIPKKATYQAAGGADDRDARPLPNELG
jgi:hypothetical protein